ncbi:alpha/beta hydrolase family esterase [Promicromonospora vindobonensis]|uniref:Alpha/beta hydrolase family esterase n=1 Tax=Promicromonospora vindobonensis TaxID=195748 RepID=A0ABW5VXF6_9MICO
MTLTTVPMSIDVGGRSRTLSLVEGAAAPGRALLLVFHGSKQTGVAHRRFTGGSFDALAESGAAVVAYLDGYQRNWNDARKESAFPARVENVDDVSFTRRVIADLVASHDIDPRRVYAAGYSNGGQMVLRLLHEAPELFAGVAIVAATMPVPESFLAPASDPEPVPTPVLLIHGTRDPVVPYEGGRFPAWVRRFLKVDGVGRSAPETARYLARRNGILGDPVVADLPTGGQHRARTWVEQTDFREEGRPPVRLLTVHGGGHTVPGPRRAPFVLGRTAQDISAAPLLAEFLEITASGGRRLSA